MSLSDIRKWMSLFESSETPAKPLSPLDVAEEQASELWEDLGTCDRVVWEKESVIEANSLDAVGYRSVDGVYGLHVGDPEFWFNQLVHDYGRDNIAYVMEINCLPDDVLVPDEQIMDRTEINAHVLLTTRQYLHEGKDFRYTRTLTEADLVDPEEDDEDGDDPESMWESQPPVTFGRYNPSNPNSGHGHIFTRPDGMRARCMGPDRCSVCASDKKLNLSESMATTKYLYHTTSNHAAYEILQSGEVRPKNYEGFVSFSLVPLPYGDIEATDVTLIFRAQALHSQLIEVEYDESWYHDHPEQARYVAGEGWEEQFFYEPDEDEDEFDDSAEEEARSNAEMDAFIVKLGEDEWISLKSGVPVRFNKQDFCGLIANHPNTSIEDNWKEELVSLGYNHATVGYRKS